MFPSFAANEAPDRVLAYPMVLGQRIHCRLTTGVGITNQDYIRFGKLRGRHAFSPCSSRGIPALLRAVSVVVASRSRPDMTRVAASSVIARMTHIVTYWRRSIRDGVSKTMGANGTASEFEVSVSTVFPAADGAKPRPARISTARAVNVRPESCNFVRGILRVHLGGPFAGCHAPGGCSRAGALLRLRSIAAGATI